MKKVLVVMAVCLVLGAVGNLTAARAQDAGADLEAKYGVSNDLVLNERLQRVGAIVSLGVSERYPNCRKRLRYRILDTEELNAMALSDGRIYITRGMMAALAGQPDDELASVLNHEAAHVAQGHHRRQARVGFGTVVAKIAAAALGASKDVQTGIGMAGGLWGAGYSREDEYRADAGSVELNELDRYDPAALGRVLGTLKDRYGNGLAGVPVIGWFASHPDTGSRIERVAKLAGQIGTVGGPTPVTARSTVPSRRIEIDADQIRMSGDGSWWLEDNLAAMLRNRARGSGIEVAISGREFEDVAATQDRIHDSGRYSTESRADVPRGEMTAPTEHWSLTGIAEVSYKDRDIDGRIIGRSGSYQERTTVAQVRLVLEPIDIVSGLNEPGYEAAGTASSTDRRVAGGSWGRYGSYRSDSSRSGAILIERAASRAVDNLIAQMAAPALRPAVGELAMAPDESVPPAQVDLDIQREFVLLIRPMGTKEGDPRTIKKVVRASLRSVLAADTIMFVTPDNVGVAKVAISRIEGDQIFSTLMFPSWSSLKLDGPLSVRFIREELRR